MARRVGLPLTGRAAARRHEHTDGHPLYVRTLLGELSAAQLQAPDGDLPVPRSLASTTLARTAELSVDARALGAAMAVVALPIPLALAGRIAGIDRPAEALEDLLSTGFVTWSPGNPGTPVGFAHPLYRAALYADLSPTRRRELHRAAAEVLDARSALAHRVAAADGVDDDLADELSEASRRERLRGARNLAATYLLWASPLGSERSSSEDRLLQAARLLLEDGQTQRAAELRGRLEGCSDSSTRSLVLGMLAWEQGESASAERWLLEAAGPTGEHSADGEVAAAALGHLGLLYYTQGRGQEAVNAGTTVLSLDHPAAELERSGWMAVAIGEATTRGAPAGIRRLADRLPQRASEVPADDVDLLIVRGTLGFYAGHTTAAIADMRSAILLARGGAAAAQLPRAHLQVSQLLLSSGELDEALVHARVALSLVSEERRVWMEAQVHAALARLFAARGEWDTADEHVRAANAAAGVAGTVEAAVTARIAEAAVARARHEPRRVVDLLGPLIGDGRAIPMSTSLAWWPSLVTAMIECGDLDAAEAQIGPLERAAELRGLDLRARIAGTRAQLEGARGLDQAASAFAEAIALLGPDDPLLDRAGLHHFFGRLLAARGRRRQAVDQLRIAHDLLARAGAEPFLQRVDADLASAGIKAAPRGSRSPLDLTEREHDVVALVSKGMTNREVAAELYISAKAIDYHLGNIFRKLGISSRRELRRRFNN
jgi:DNA-binding CsgD family transcriptional regulator